MVFDEYFSDISLIKGKINNLFVNIDENLNRNLPTNNVQHTQFPIPNGDINFFLFPVTSHECYHATQKLKSYYI